MLEDLARGRAAAPGRLRALVERAHALRAQGARPVAAEEERVDRLLSAVAEVRDGLANGLAQGFAEPRRER